MTLSGIPGLYNPTPSGSGTMFPSLSPTSQMYGNPTGNTGQPKMSQPYSTSANTSSDFMSQMNRNSVGPQPQTPVTRFAPLANIGASDGGSPATAAPYSGSSNTAGGGATLTDANSSPSGSGYGQTDLGKENADFLTRQIKDDQQLQSDLATIGAQQGNYLGSFTGGAQQAEINSGYSFDPAMAARLGFNIPTGVGPDGKPVDLYGPLFSALSDPQTLANAQANPYSQRAQIDYATQHALNAQDAQMVANGMARSGDYQDSTGNYVQNYDANGNPTGGPGGYQHQGTMYQQQLANYNAMQDFLGKLTSGYNTYEGQLGNLQTATSTARNNALNRILAMINAGALTLPGSQTHTTQPPYPAGNAPPPQVGGPTPFAPGITTQQYAQSPTGQDIISQLMANPAIGSNGAAGSLLSGGQDPNYQANKNLANEQNNVPAVAAPSSQIPSWMTNGGWGSFGWGGSPAGMSGANDGSYDAWVAAGGDNPTVPINDTGSVLGDAQASWMANTPNPNQVYQQFGLSPGIGNWRT